MGVSKYVSRGRSWWRVDEWLTLPDGRLVRYRKKKVPTKEQAEMLAAKRKMEAFEGHFFEQPLLTNQRDTSELPCSIDGQYVEAHGASLYTLSSAYAFPLALSSIRRKLTVAGYWFARERGSVRVPSRPVPTTR